MKYTAARHSLHERSVQAALLDDIPRFSDLDPRIDGTAFQAGRSVPRQSIEVVHHVHLVVVVERVGDVCPGQALQHGIVPQMAKAALASVQLARFDRLRGAGPAPDVGAPGTLFCHVAADTRAAGTEPASQQAFTFLILGLHVDRDSAQRFVTDRVAWFDDSQEVWSGMLEPFRHHGAANYLDRANPGHLFESMMPADLADGPVVALTTSGWNVGDGLDMNRVREFGAGVLAVRASMTGVPGLRSQHSFFFPDVLACDPMTLTFWRDEASIRAFAYGQGSHRRQLDRHRAEGLADRTSFTRFRVLSSAGTWHGEDPAARIGHEGLNGAQPPALSSR